VGVSETDEAAARLQAELAPRLAPWLLERTLGLCEAWGGRPAASQLQDDLTAAATDAAGKILGELAVLMHRDVDEQSRSPLDVVRRGLTPLSDVLEAAGVPPVVRDEFEERYFPEDRYGLAPAAWADIDEALTEPGLVWGAAKARAHLRARTDSGPSAGEGATSPVSTGVVAFVPDLMDQSRLRAAGDIAFVRSPAELIGSQARLVLVDLARPGVLEVVGRVGARVVGFHPHVDEDLASAARAAGCGDVLVRSVFFRRIGSLLAEAQPPADKM